MRIIHPSLVLQSASALQSPAFTSSVMLGTFVLLEAAYKNTIQRLSKKVANMKLAHKHLLHPQHFAGMFGTALPSCGLLSSAGLKAKLG